MFLQFFCIFYKIILANTAGKIILLKLLNFFTVLLLQQVVSIGCL